MRGLGLMKPNFPIKPNNNRHRLNIKFNQIPKSCIADVSGCSGLLKLIL